MMKRMGWLAAALIVCAPAVAFADGVQGGNVGSGEEGSAIKMYTIARTENSVGKNGIAGFGKGSQILGLKTIPQDGATQAYCTLYDSASVVGAATSAVIDELPEQNGQRGAQIQIWPFPFRLVTGLSVASRNADCIIYYR